MKSKLNKRKNYKLVQKQDKEYPLIDGKNSLHPFGYCELYKNYLTKSLSETHKCREIGCVRFKLFEP